jgi:hypothetical protein
MVDRSEADQGHRKHQPYQRHREHHHRQRHLPKWWLFLLFVASGLLLSFAEFVAANGNKWLPFYIFWIGYFAVVLPVGWLLARASTRDAHRGPLVLALAVWSLLPKLIRTGDQPLYFDEFSHLRLLQDLLHAGHPVAEPVLLQVGSSFPGLEMVTGAVVQVSGLHPWGAAMTVAAISHVAILAAIFVLVSDVTMSKRAGALAALVYSLNPSWLYFDSQYAYETLAIPLLLWGLVFALRAIGTRTSKPSSVWTWVGLSFLCSMSLVITHHATAVFNCILLTAMAVVVMLRRRTAPARAAESPRIAWLLAVWALLVTTARFLDIGHPLAVYLASILNVSGELRQLLSFLGISSSVQSQSRVLFSGSSLPSFEIACGFLLPPVLLVAFGWAIWGLFTKRHELGSFLYVGALTGLGYFASLPLLTSGQFAFAVHRSWALSYIGLAMVIGLAVDRFLRGELSFPVGDRQVARLQQPEARWSRIVAMVMLVVAAIGGVAVGTSVVYRFGSPVHYGEDAAADGTQTNLVAAWFHDHGLRGQLVFADRYVSDPIAVHSDVSLVAPSALWGITFDSQVSPHLVSQFNKVDYVVVDRRMGNGKAPPQGFWYATGEPDGNSQVVPSMNVLRFQCFNWLNAVFATTDYEILAVDHAQLETDIGLVTNGLDGACMARLGHA